MPKIVLNCTLTPNQGKYSFDPVSKVLLWDIGRIDVSKLPNLRGSVRLINYVFIENRNIIMYHINIRENCTFQITIQNSAVVSESNPAINVRMTMS